MRKIIILVFSLLLTVTLVGCDWFDSLFSPIEKKPGAVNFTNLATDVDVSSKFLNIFYPEDDIPYVEADEFMTTIDGAINNIYYVKKKDTTNQTFTLKPISLAGSSAYLTFDIKNNEIVISQYEVFSFLPAITDLALEINNLITVSNVEESLGEDVVIDLDNYNMNLYYDKKDGFLVPLHLANLLLSGSSYDVYYNGVEAFGINSDCLNATTLRKIKVNDLNTKEMSDSYKAYNYNFITLTFDYFYGLKSETLKEKNSFKEYINKEYMVGLNSSDSYQAYSDFILSLDEMHSRYYFPGYYADISYWPDELDSNKGPRTLAFDSRREELFLTHPDYDSESKDLSKITYLDDGKIAIVYFNSFSLDGYKEIRKKLNNLPSTVEEVVFDLSMNTGGMLGAAFLMLSFMSNEQIPFSNYNPFDNSTSTGYYKARANNYLNKDIYIVTSKVTYSAANYTTFTAKDSGWATILGENTGGGACAIALIFPPDGSCLIISSDLVISDEDFNHLEYGVEVDYVMNDVTDREELENIIKSFR